LLTLAYYLLAAAIAGKDREVLEARLREAATVYEAAVSGHCKIGSTIRRHKWATLYTFNCLDNFNRVVYAHFLLTG